MTALNDAVRGGIDDVLRPEWAYVDGRVVPKAEDINLTNGAVRLNATYLYADMADSTGLAQGYRDWAAAKVIRCYLNAATRLINVKGGHIRSFDGDRVMGIFIGPTKNNDAVRAGMMIHWAVNYVIRPKLKEKWDSFDWTMKHGVGIDAGDALLVRGGVHGLNDIVSIGGAPNVAAKLSEIRGYDSIMITPDVYESLEPALITANAESVWTRRSGAIAGKSRAYYSSHYHVEP